MMQLSRMVQFYKAIADPTRIRILALLAKESLHGQALAGKLGLAPPTITHHAAKLREVGLIQERRNKNTIYFILNKTSLFKDAQAIVTLLSGDKRGGEVMESSRDQFSIIQNFFSPDGKLKQLPVKRKKKVIVLEYLVRGLEIGRKYTEKEINEHILQYHEDFATIRREFVVNQLMYRENGIYELNPRDLWSNKL